MDIFVSTQVPNFGVGPDALAMDRRMHVFKCQTIPNCRAGYEVMFRRKAMDILHWIITEISEMPLFDDQDITFGDDDEDRLEGIITDQQPSNSVVIPVPDLASLTHIDESVLPYRAVVRAHLDVYDAIEDGNNPPLRLTSRAYDVASTEYHQSVYLNIKDYTHTVDVNVGIDYEALFKNRKEQGWTGVDSLYHAWLLVNHRRTPRSFSMKKFKERYPDWKEVMMSSMNLTPYLELTPIPTPTSSNEQHAGVSPKQDSVIAGKVL